MDRDVVAVVAAGGIVGACGRYSLGTAFPWPGSGFPWATFAVNVSGCLLIGALMAVLAERAAPHRLARPFLGTGVLGGYTTFSTYSVEAVQLIDRGHPATALYYLAGTLAAALPATWAGAALARAAARPRKGAG